MISLTTQTVAESGAARAFPSGRPSPVRLAPGRLPSPMAQPSTWKSRGRRGAFAARRDGGQMPEAADVAVAARGDGAARPRCGAPFKGQVCQPRGAPRSSAELREVIIQWPELGRGAGGAPPPSPSSFTQFRGQVLLVTNVASGTRGRSQRSAGGGSRPGRNSTHVTRSVNAVKESLKDPQAALQERRSTSWFACSDCVQLFACDLPIAFSTESRNAGAQSAPNPTAPTPRVAD
eukprot:gene16803-biopygen6752